MEYEPDLKWLYAVALLHIVVLILVIGIVEIRGGTTQPQPPQSATETALETVP